MKTALLYTFLAGHKRYVRRVFADSLGLFFTDCDARGLAIVFDLSNPAHALVVARLMMPAVLPLLSRPVVFVERLPEKPAPRRRTPKSAPDGRGKTERGRMAMSRVCGAERGRSASAGKIPART